MLDLIFRSCSKRGGAELALHILHEGTSQGLISQQVRSSGVSSLLGLCSANEDWDVDMVINAISDEDRESPEVLAALGAVFCSGTRSPF